MSPYGYIVHKSPLGDNSGMSPNAPFKGHDPARDTAPKSVAVTNSYRLHPSTIAHMRNTRLRTSLRSPSDPVVLAIPTIRLEFDQLSFFCRSFSRALLLAEFLRQAVSRLLLSRFLPETQWFPPRMQSLALGAPGLASGCLRKTRK
jgi:hypothetical protein